MDSAARKIQATYRGHSIRQSLRTWELPSGRTLYQTMEEAKRRAFLRDINMEQNVELFSDHYKPVRIPSVPPSGGSSKRQSKSPNMDDPSSLGNLVSEALESSKLSLEDAERSLTSINRNKTISKVGKF